MSTEELELFDTGDGTFVTSDGEIVELPTGGDRDAYAARRYREAKDQTKQWQREAAIYGGYLMKYCPEPMVWDDFTTRVQQGSHPVQDLPVIAETIIATAFEIFTVDEIEEQLYAVLKAVAKWDAKEAPQWAAEIIADHTKQVPNRPYVAIGGIKRAAPQRQKAEATA